ncbi:hypothetical protein HA402_005950 [Bradysia odoriphaga]|nr:hypothetical protein HA402_005950 [Bradysia odoriphaga]
MYSSDWEKSYKWLKKSSDSGMAACKICNLTFRIDNSGLCQVKSHEKSKKHITSSDTLAGKNSQNTFRVGSNGEVEMTKGKQLITDSGLSIFLTQNFLNSGRHFLSDEDKILSAEIYWALKCVHSGFSFASNQGNNELFRKMFPDSNIASNFKMSKTKCNYLVQFGIYPWVMEDLLLDFKGTPFSYKFDETTTSQIKKQYDGYVQYESKRFGDVVNRYCGSLFLGHCKAIDLKDHFFHFGRMLPWDIHFLLQVKTDGPNLNLLFHKLLKAQLKEEYDKTIIDFGTCNLHKVHNGFSTAIKELSFDINAFVYDVWYFFKNSSARREDYKLSELVTEIECQVILKHVSSRWLTLRPVLQRIMSQWDNLKDYFLNFLPRQENFTTKVETTARYQSIRKALTSITSVLYMSFVVYLAEILEEFLILFQSSKPLVHVLYPSIGDLFFKIMTNFVKKSALVDKNGARRNAKELGKLDMNDKCNLISLHNIDFGHKALYQIGLIEAKTTLDSVKTEFKTCYQSLTKNNICQRLPPPATSHGDLTLQPPQTTAVDEVTVRSENNKSLKARSTSSVMSRRALLALQRLEEERVLRERRENEALQAQHMRDQEYMRQRYAI